MSNKTIKPSYPHTNQTHVLVGVVEGLSNKYDVYYDNSDSNLILRFGIKSNNCINTSLEEAEQAPEDSLEGKAFIELAKHLTHTIFRAQRTEQARTNNLIEFKEYEMCS